MLWVLENKTVTLGDERVGGLVTCDALIGKVLEDLLECRLADTVLLNTQWTLCLLELAKEPADGFVFFWNSQFKEFTTVFKDLNVTEVTGQEPQDTKTVSLSFQELENVDQADLSLIVEVSFLSYVRTDDTDLDLLKDHLVKSSVSQLLQGLL